MKCGASVPPTLQNACHRKEDAVLWFIPVLLKVWSVDQQTQGIRISDLGAGVVGGSEICFVNSPDDSYPH